MPSKTIYALVGSENFLQLENLATIRKTLKGAQELEFDGERASLTDVLDELRSFSMFASAKLVVVRNADAFITRHRDGLEEYISHPADSGTLVLRCESLPKNQRIYKLIDKAGEIMPCEPPKGASLTGWITQRGKTVHKLAVDPQAAAALAEYIGDDLGRLDNELAKLALQVGDGKVTAEAVRGSVSFQREQEMWDMTNELAAGQTSAALKRWRQLSQLDTSAEFRAVTWLTMWLEETGRIISGGDTSKLSWKYKDRLQQVIKTAKAMGASRHAAAVALLAEMDRRTKTGLGNAAENVEQFILSLAPSN